jgi:hypothetical protein
VSQILDLKNIKQISLVFKKTTMPYLCFHCFILSPNPISLSKFLSNITLAVIGSERAVAVERMCRTHRPLHPFPRSTTGSPRSPPQAGSTVTSTVTLSLAPAPGMRTGSRMGQWTCWPTTVAHWSVPSPTSSYLSLLVI